MGLLVKDIFYDYQHHIKLNEYVFTSVEVKEGTSQAHINRRIPSKVFDDFINLLYGENFNNLVFVCRSSLEPNTKEFPTQTNIQKLKELKLNSTIFYQDPWPAGVPEFSSDKTVIRFGYDECSKYDKEFIPNSTVDVDENNGIYYYLVGGYKIYEIKNKKSIL